VTAKEEFESKFKVGDLIIGPDYHKIDLIRVACLGDYQFCGIMQQGFSLVVFPYFQCGWELNKEQWER